MEPLFAEKLLEHVAQQPDNMAVSFLSGEKAITSLTYQQLQHRSYAVTQALQQQCEVGDRVLVMLPPSIDYVVAVLGCLQAGVVAVPCYPPMNQHFADSLAHIISDCQPRLMITNFKLDLYLKVLQLQHDTKSRILHNSLKKIFHASDIALAPQLIALPELMMHRIRRSKSGARPHHSTPDTLAFLQYTSGTTGKPKGIMVSQGNLIANIDVVRRNFFNEKSIGCIWLPPYHSMGLFGGVLPPLYCGIPIYLRSPHDFIQNPMQWLLDISRYKATVSGGPNFAYAMCSKLNDDLIPKDLDLSSWEIAFCGSEMVQESIMKAFFVKFAPYGFDGNAFFPCYGLGEMTAYVTGARGDLKTHTLKVDREQMASQKITAAKADSKDILTLFTSGQNYSNQKIVIVEPTSHQPLADNQIGKVMLQAPSMTQGYWQRPEATQETFQQTIVGYDGYFLDTGDLGAMVNDHLLITGRLKNLLIIHGLNYNTSLIESDISDVSPELNKSGIAVIQIETSDNEGIMVLAEVKQHLAEKVYQQLAESISKKVLDANRININSIYFLEENGIIRTASGKISPQHSRDALQANKLSCLYHWQADGSKTHEDNQHVLDLKAEYCKLSAEKRRDHVKKMVMRQLKQQGYRGRKLKKLSQAKFDSIKLVAFLAGIEKDLVYLVRLPTSSFYQYDKFDKFVRYVDDLLDKSLHDVTQASNENDSLPLLPLQVFYLNHIKVQKFHLGKVLDVNSDISIEKFRQAIEAVMAIQPYLHAKVVLSEEYFHLENTAVTDSYHWQTDELAGDDLVTECNAIANELCLSTDYWQGKLLAVSYAREKNSDKRYALIVVNHMVIDPVSFYYFLQQLDQALHDGLPSGMSEVINQDLRGLQHMWHDEVNNCLPPVVADKTVTSNNQEADAVSDLVTLDDGISQALLNLGDKLDATIIAAWGKAYAQVKGISQFDLICIRDGHAIFDIKAAINFSCLYMKLVINSEKLQKDKKAVTYIAKLLQEKQLSVLQENIKASVDPSYIDFSESNIEYSNLGADDRFIGQVIAENTQFGRGYLSDTFDSQLTRYREIFIRPVIVDNSVHILSSFAGRLYDAETIKAINAAMQVHLLAMLKL